MAIIENLWLRKSKKRLGGVVLYQAMEQTRARELASSVANPRTTSQMTQRVKWAQLVNFYRANGNWMKYAYETKSANQSDYNKFMSLNVADSRVYLSKFIAAAGSCLVYPYIMTQGSLPSIEFTEGTNDWLSNIYYPEGSPILPTTTIAEFSQNILQYNPAVRSKDQLSFIRFTQMFNSDTGYPYVIVRKYEIVLDEVSTELVGSYLPLDYIGLDQFSSPGCLRVINSGLAGGFCMILSRTVGGKTYVSSQRIITVDMGDQLVRFGSQLALDLAIQSYGENEDAFLSSTSAGINSQAPTPLAIVAIEVGDNILPPGTQVKMADFFHPGDEVAIRFNGDLTGQTISSAILPANFGSATLQNLQISGQRVIGEFPSGSSITEDSYLAAVNVRTSSGYYYAPYIVPNT